MEIHRGGTGLGKASSSRLTPSIVVARAATEAIKAMLLPVARLLRTARVLLYPSQMRRLNRLGFLRQFGDRETCHFIGRRHYLSRHFSVRDRIHNALLHYEHESLTFDSTYRAMVYKGDGLLLWRELAQGVECSIRLVLSDGNGYEGDLSVIVEVNGNEVCRMSYTVVDWATFGPLSGPTLFVTRNQVKRTPELELFRRCYRHSSPQYFCLAAVAGIALANGFDCIAAIRGNAQVFYKPALDESFENSYCRFWQQFGANAIDRQAWHLKVPLTTTPISSVKQKHRTRANDRRARWTAVTAQAASAMALYKVQKSKLTGLKVWLHPLLCMMSQVFCDYAAVV